MLSFADPRQRRGCGGRGDVQEEVGVRVLHLQQLAEQHEVHHVQGQQARQTLWLREYFQCSCQYYKQPER